METEKAFFNPEAEIKKEVAPELKKDPEVSELQREGERIYSEEYAQKLNAVLEHKFIVEDRKGGNKEVVLKDIVDKHLEGFSSPEFSNLPIEEKADKQREFVTALGCGINSMPPDTWSFYFGRIIETGKIDCSGSAALLGMILENTKEKTGIKNVEYGLPYGHAVNIITFEDNQLYWADARNNWFENISGNAKIENNNGLKVYKFQQPSEKTGKPPFYQIVPATSIKEGIISSDLNNTDVAYAAAAEGKIAKSLKASHSKEELQEIQKTAEEVCRERNSPSPEVRKFFNDKMEKYHRSEEFKEEEKRILSLWQSRKEQKNITS